MSGWEIFGMISAGIIVLTVAGLAVLDVPDTVKYVRLLRMSSGRASLH